MPLLGKRPDEELAGGRTDLTQAVLQSAEKGSFEGYALPRGGG